MNKSDLIAKIAQDAEISKTTATKTLDSMLEGVSQALADGNAVTLVGFGTFSVANRPTRTGRNPQTGEAIQIAAKNVVKFKAGKGLKDAV